jgi:hypothetical protein
MGRMNVNRQNLLCVKLLQLRRHLNSCNECRGAIKGREYAGMCEWTQAAVIEVAVKWDANIPGRLAAHHKGEGWIFPCPDPNAHGPAYAVTAEPCVVSGTQESLF